MDSPYETRQYDWIPKLSNDQSQTEVHGEGNGLDWCFCDPAWNSEDSDTSTLVSLGSLWDMNWAHTW
jgi:myb proto-oncogene protein